MYNYLRNKTILYIEDDVEVLKNISSFMQNYFLNVFSVPNAEDGLELFSSYSIDLLIVDVELPGINGIEFIKKIRETDKDISIVVISAYTKTDYLLESVELKLDGYIVKPFTSKKIYEFLEKNNTLFKEKNDLRLTSEVTLYRDDSSLIFDKTKHILSPKEFEFLELLILKDLVYYDDLDFLWEEIAPSAGAIRSFIQHIRKKLPENTIKNRQNIGYYV